MSRHFFLLFLSFILCLGLCAQADKLDSVALLHLSDNNEMEASPNKRPILVGAATLTFSAGSLIALNHAWYKEQSRSRFHPFNDSREWLQVDKAGHAWSAYSLSRTLNSLWTWSGVDDKKALLAGSLTSMAYLTAIEVMDGYAEKWGWSWADMAANTLGTGLFAAQAWQWNEQRISLKYSAHTYSYGPDLSERANNLFGSSVPERILKDYNRQTYWLSANVKSFMPERNIPGWLNIAVGYGAGGMFGGFENRWTNDDGQWVERFDIPRVREFYLSPDIDFTRIKTNRKFVRTLFFVMNSLKFPAPALMIDSRGKIKAYPVYF